MEVDEYESVETQTYERALSGKSEPNKSWIFPSLEQVEAFTNNLKVTSPHLLELESICENSLGYYLVFSFFD